jgi:hypothetical protein
MKVAGFNRTHFWEIFIGEIWGVVSFVVLMGLLVPRMSGNTGMTRDENHQPLLNRLARTDSPPKAP